MIIFIIALLNHQNIWAYNYTHIFGTTVSEVSQRFISIDNLISGLPRHHDLITLTMTRATFTEQAS